MQLTSKKSSIMNDSTTEKDMSRATDIVHDVESGSSKNGTAAEVDIEEQFQKSNLSIWAKLSSHGVELRGAEPVPVEKRTDTRYINVLTVFATSMTSLLP